MNNEHHEAMIYQLTMCSIDNDAELMEELAEQTWRNIATEDAEARHKSHFYALDTSLAL